MNRIFLDRMSLMAMLFLLPFAARAQDEGEMSFSEDEVEQTPPPEESQPSGDEGTMTFGAEGEGSGETGEPGGGAGEGAGGDVSQAEILGVLGDDSSIVDTKGGLDAEASKEGVEIKTEGLKEHPIWAVQRIYVLKSRRVELQPTFGFSTNDPYMQHQAFNVALNYYITEVLAAGISANVYAGMGALTSLNFSLKRATHQVVPVNEYLVGGQLNFSYVPIFGKFKVFRNFILHWDVWVVGGGGFLFSRPVPVIDPDYRDFKYTIKYCFNVGIGWRLFFSRFLAITWDLRDYIYPEELESLTIEDDRTDNTAWLQDDTALTNNVMFSVGITLLIPFTVEYKLKK
jgi:outer membrane beta-barrel protein